MTAGINGSVPSVPDVRPYLTIVKSLDLDAVKVAKADGPRARRVAQDFSAANDGFIYEPGRNNALASLAGTMRRRGMSKEAVEAALQADNLARIRPPLDPAEVNAIAASIGRYPAADNDDDILKTLTDTGNAARFGRRYKADVMHVFGMGWFIWDDDRWKRDAVDQIVEMAKEVAREIYAEGDALASADARIAVAKHAKLSQQAPRLDAMQRLAKSLPELVALPTDLDAHDMLLGVANGVVDLCTGKLRPTQRSDLLTRHSPVEFDAKAKCPRFVAFINEVTGGDKRLASYLQRVVGYALTGKANEQCLFFLHGGGANGKSVFLAVFKDLLGTELVKQTPSETLMTKRATQTNDIARLKSVRVVIANEVEDGTLLAESLVKQMTGGDTMTARFHYQEFFEYTPKFKLFIAGNHKPVIQGRDNGIWRRMRLIPFDVTIAPAKRDKHLQDKLRAELPGILNWAIKGCLAWQAKALAEPIVVSQAVDAYKADMDVIAQWMADCCTVQVTADWKVSLAYHSYKAWAVDSGYRPMALGMFSRDMELRFTRQKRKDATYLLGIAGR